MVSFGTLYPVPGASLSSSGVQNGGTGIFLENSRSGQLKAVVEGIYSRQTVGFILSEGRSRPGWVWEEVLAL